MTDVKKDHLSIVICGEVDSGKSTTTGHLLFALGGISDREMERLKQTAKELGKDSFAFAFYMDNNKEERERGITIQCNTKEFFTDSKHYTIIDAPGHRDFIKNMIGGASQADCALLMIPSNKGAFESAIQKADHSTGQQQGQTRQHARLLYLLGVEQIIVGVNKMDDTSVQYSEARYNEIKEEMTKMLQSIGFKPKKIPFIPLSGWTGENLTHPSTNMPWYKGFECNINPKEVVKGHTLVDALDKLMLPPKRNADGALRMSVSGIYSIKGIGTVVAGRIEQGTLRPNDIVGFTPSNITGCKVFSIEMHHKSYPQAIPGDNIGINLKGLDKDNLPKTGDVMYIVKENVLKPVQRFRAMVFVQEHPGQLKKGFCPIVHIRTAKTACKIVDIHWKMSKKTANVKVENPEFIEAYEQAELSFEPQLPFYCEDFESSPGLGRVAIMESNSLVMLGKIMNVEYKVDK
jgi:elongation factor 1-alpha